LTGTLRYTSSSGNANGMNSATVTTCEIASSASQALTREKTIVKR
jgi:hypothetical protein